MKSFRVKKAAVLLTAIVLLLAAAVGGTVAYLVASTGEVVNTFTPTNVPIEVVESFDGKTKSIVAIKNNGNIPAYIRAQVIITWQDENGNVHARKPVAGTDYMIRWGSNIYWTNKETDVITYYQKPILPNNSTGILISECTPVQNQAPDGYHLHVEVLAQSIQAVPSSVVEKAWNVTTGPIEEDGNTFIGILP